MERSRAVLDLLPRTIDRSPLEIIHETTTRNASMLSSLFAELRVGEDIAYRSLPNISLCYGRIGSVHANQLTVRSYRLCDYDQEDYVDDPDPYLKHLRFLSIEESMECINYADVVTIIYVLRHRDIFNRPLPINFEAMELVFRLRNEPVRFQSYPPISVSA